MIGLDFPHKITEEYFGGREQFYRNLMDAGLLSNVCSCGSDDLSLYFEKNLNFPRVYCRGCKKKCPSINNGSIFQRLGIVHIPAFIFLCNCFILNVPFEASVRLSGLDPGTARTYFSHVSVLIDIFIQHQNRGMEKSLGGDGKVVEIDEVFITKRKCNRGKMPAKGQIIMFGLTERDGGPVKVEDQELHDYLVRKEAYRSEQEALKERGGLRQPHERRRQRQENHQDQHVASDGAETFVTEGPFTRVIVWDEDDEGEDDAIEDVEVP